MAEDVEDGHELLVLPLIALAPIPLFLVSPALALLPYFVVPAILFMKRERPVELGGLGDGKPVSIPKVKPSKPRPKRGPTKSLPKETRQAWVCLECWVVFTTRGTTAPDCPRCKMPYGALKLEPGDVDAGKAMDLDGASHAWRRTKLSELWPRYHRT